MKPLTAGPRRSTSGAILLFVLVWLSLLASIAVVRLSQVEERFRVAHGLREPAEVHFLLGSGLEVTLASLIRWREEQGAWRSIGEEWGNPYAYLDLEQDSLPAWSGNLVELSHEDLSGRIAFGLLSEEDWEVLLGRGRFDQREVRRFLDRLGDWTDGDDFRRPEGAEYREYGFASSDVLRLPPNRPIRDRWEWTFFLEKAFPEGLSEALEDFLQDAFHFAPVAGANINAAPARVLEMLLGRGGWGVQGVIDARQRVGLGGTVVPITDASAYTGVDSLESAALRLGSEVGVLRVTASLPWGSGVYRRSWIVLLRDPASGNPEMLSGFYRHRSGFLVRED